MDQNSTSLTLSNSAIPAFDPVPTKARHDGWTPEKQIAFIEALAECGCVSDAARRVGMSPQSAYALRGRSDAQHFRRAWRFASQHGAEALGDEAWSRALHGTVTPIFYRGEQVGERRHYDERLTMFLLRHRDPARFGKWIEKAGCATENPDAAIVLTKLLNLLSDNLYGVENSLKEYGLVDCAIDQDIEEDEDEEEDDEGPLCCDDDDDDEWDDDEDEDEDDADDDDLAEPEKLESVAAAGEGSDDGPGAISPGAYPSTSSTLTNRRDDPEWCAMVEENMRRYAAERRATKAAERARLPRATSFRPASMAHLPPWM